MSNQSQRLNGCHASYGSRVWNVIMSTLTVDIQLYIVHLSLHNYMMVTADPTISRPWSFPWTYFEHCYYEVFGAMNERMDEKINKTHSLVLGSNVLYISSTDLESLTGPEAITRAIEQTFVSDQPPPKITEVHFKVTSLGITLTDNKRR